MNGTLIDQPRPAMPCPPAELYDSVREGLAVPRAAGSVIGTLKVAIPVESSAEKLSPIPWILPSPDGSEIAWLLTPDLSAPVGSALGAAMSAETAGAAAVADLPPELALSRAVPRRGGSVFESAVADSTAST